MIRVLIVDDHKLFREGLQLLLMPAKDIEVVGEARDGQDGIELAQRLQPDVILMDLEMPRVDGLKATRQLLATNTPSKILVLSMRTNEKDIRDAAQSGARGYLVKNCGRAELTEAIRSVYRGERVASADVADLFSAVS